MIIKVEELQNGSILAEDIYIRTNRPIITAKTVLEEEHIKILKAFLVKEIVIENTQIDGTKIMESSSSIPKQIREEKKNDFLELFLQTVQLYKKEFISWQSGLSVNIANVRNILLPLLDELESVSKEIFSLYHLSNKKEYLYQHSIAVAVISALIAQKMNYSYRDMVQVALAGCLSDAGMAKINQRLLHKIEPLTEEEFNEVKKHTRYSLEMIPEHTLLKNETRLAIYQHHERVDGSGYPMGNADNKIHAFAKIIAVADTFHAMTSERLYRKKQSPFRVVEQMRQDHFGKFDITVLQSLSNAITQFTTGSKIRLSNGEKAEILFISNTPTRPLVKTLENNLILDLEKNRHLFIEETLEY
ncbi:HD-GYP domain-containing protein [Niallia sp. FSL W8-0635]|uniref:HD-GYP domain-containing protein n=1 Tax=Niallia sp. FSL W8-0635 TaxID=2975337 RepID=UPI0009CAACFA|nr:LuxR family transcriptional regulator [Mycobacteroides abscessus subsp. abscessus]HEO8420260.1 HD-GYP domain-containing protein [Yersinia enterocolitica]